MSQAGLQQLRSGQFSIRKGNRKKSVSFWAQGHRLLLALSIGFILITFALVFVRANHQTVQFGYQINQLHQRQQDLVDLNRKLKLELANLTSLNRLENLAKKEFGLAAPRPEQVVVVK